MHACSFSISKEEDGTLISIGSAAVCCVDANHQETPRKQDSAITKKRLVYDGNKPCMWPCGGRVVASVRASYNNIVFSRVKCMHGLVSGCMDKLLAGRDFRVVTWACAT